MLELINITKDYTVADDKVHALRGVSISFRKSEFVSVLGPSGCGKTTLLNIIGGLDHATSGELIINGISTKSFKDRDWDTYRNHSIGFVFQSYNLIPHQTILENVELALNISGVPKAERIKRAKEALDKVGLEGLYKKKPNQLSGGQMQRVAIARALVGDPEILLADEPTGALDSETSVQIMDLIKEISRERLVIMVTHNPDLAETYSTRIVKLLDGNIVDDTMPFEPDTEKPEAQEQPAEANAEQNIPEQSAEQPASEEETEQADTVGNNVEEQAPDVKTQNVQRSAEKKSKLSLWSAFRLSFRNLLSKFKRTLLVCFAGSIGIIGVTTVLAVSTGVNNFIDDMQNDMLSGNPIQISETYMDTSRIMEISSNATKAAGLKQSVQKGKINVNSLIKFLADRAEDMNEIFGENDITQEYVDFVDAMPKKYYAAIEHTYGVSVGNNIYTTYDFEGQQGEKISFAAAKEIYTSLLSATPFSDYTQYVGMISNSFREAPVTTDFVLSQYDILTPNPKYPTEKNEIMLVVDEDTELTDILLAQLGYYTQEEFLNIAYSTQEEDGGKDKYPYPTRFEYKKLTDKKFYWYPNDTVFTATGNPQQPFNYSAYVQDDWGDGLELNVTAILRPKKGMSYGCLKSGIYYSQALTKYAIAQADKSAIVKYIRKNMESDPKNDSLSGLITNGVAMYGVQYEYNFWYDGKKNNKEDDDPTRDTPIKGILGTSNSLSAIMSMIPGLGGSSGSAPATYSLSLRALGGCALPNAISVYPKNFELKSNVNAYLDKWNSDKTLVVNGTVIPGGKDEEGNRLRTKITYTDNLALIIGMISDMIDIVTAALVAFTALSLVVSTIMIAIITYVSVIERIKEIGVIRSLGGRKRDVSRLFTAETFMIGLVSGVIGIIVTFILTLIINGIVGHFAGITTIATLTAPIAFIMIGVSIVLTLISGLIPARLAAKKDPVVALRSE